MTVQPPDPRSDVDALLRATLADDLPPDVERRLDEQVERFLVGRRRRGRQPLASWLERAVSNRLWDGLWPSGRILRATAAIALVVGGVVLHVAAGPRVFAASVARVQESVTLWRAIDRAVSMQCTGPARDELRSPAVFADRVFRRWVLVSSRHDEAAGSMHLTFSSPGDDARYELVVDSRSMLPRRVVKTPLRGARSPAGATTAYDATCRWEPAVQEVRTDGQR